MDDLCHFVRSRFIIWLKKMDVHLHKSLFNPVSAVSGCSVSNGGCEHVCVDGYNGHYHCRCRSGYTLGDNGKTCHGMYIFYYGRH